MLGKFINHCEDSLTAAVFTHLLHLPSELFWQILRNACYSHSLPEHAGEPLSVEFRPSWNGDGTGNASRVIPDLFICFWAFDLIVEAKRWDNEKQDPGQWKNEVTAYGNEYGDEKQVRMLAIGGIRGSSDEHVPGAIRCPVHMCKWKRLLDECMRLQTELKGLKYPSSQTHACVRTLGDLIHLFACHGFSTGQWLADLDFDRCRLSSSTMSCLDLFPRYRR